MKNLILLLLVAGITTTTLAARKVTIIRKVPCLPRVTDVRYQMYQPLTMAPTVIHNSRPIVINTTQQLPPQEIVVREREVIKEIQQAVVEQPDLAPVIEREVSTQITALRGQLTAEREANSEERRYTKERITNLEASLKMITSQVESNRTAIVVLCENQINIQKVQNELIKEQNRQRSFMGQMASLFGAASEGQDIQEASLNDITLANHNLSEIKITSQEIVTETTLIKENGVIIEDSKIVKVSEKSEAAIEETEEVAITEKAPAPEVAEEKTEEAPAPEVAEEKTEEAPAPEVAEEKTKEVIITEEVVITDAPGTTQATDMKIIITDTPAAPIVKKIIEPVTVDPTIFDGITGSGVSM